MKTWVLPFPRLRFRLRTGMWCEHLRWEPGNCGRADGWRMINGGTAQMRRCAVCEWADFR